MEPRNPNAFMPYPRNEMRRGNVESANRKLIRPSLTEFKEQQFSHPQRKPQKRPSPPDQTNAENFYYVKQMQSRTPMVVVLQDGEELRGIIEWYDRSCIKVNRAGGPNLVVYKSNIKYLYKEKENERNGEPNANQAS